jgi:hypothetical protein
MLVLMAGTAMAPFTAHAARKKSHAAAAAAPQKKAEAGASAHHASGKRKSQSADEAPVRTRRGRHGKAAADSEAQPRQAVLRGRKGRGRGYLATVALGQGVAGAHGSLIRQNEGVVEDGLQRIENDQQLDAVIANKELVPVPTSSALNINESLPENRRYCRPWTASFLSDLARAHDAVFHAPLLVSSAVRTVQFQMKLRHHNRNAAPAVGDTVSPHLTGATVDIAKSPLTNAERDWMRNYLLELQNDGKIDVFEEFREACFHITVYRRYAEPSFFDFNPDDFKASLTPPASVETDAGAMR